MAESVDPRARQAIALPQECGTLAATRRASSNGPGNAEENGRLMADPANQEATHRPATPAELGSPLAPSGRGPAVLPILLTLPLVLLAVGRFLPGPYAWGFNHLAYLPGWFFGVWLTAALLLGMLTRPSVQRVVCDRLAGALPRLLFERRWVPCALAVIAGGLFFLLRERSFFMGDGYLVGELVDRGVQFRAFDSLDYLLHFQVYKQLGEGGARFSSFDLYRGSAILAGMLAVATWLRLAGRLPWSPWRKATVLGLLFFAGPAALFFGYVESYSFLFLFLTSFLLCGLLVLDGRAPLWLAATFFGLGLAFHLTALFTAPALLVLVWRAPVRPRARRVIEAFGPPVLLFLVALLLHIAEGYNAFWFRREFLEGKNAQSIWIPLAQGRGLFTAYHWKDLFNLALITAPVCLLVVSAAWRRLRFCAREPRYLFLLVQIISLAFISVAVDRKLGGARDWDLLAAHAAGLILLAAMLLPGNTPGGAVEAAVSVPAVAAVSASRGRARGREGGREGGPEGRAPTSRALLDLPHPVVPLALGVSLLVGMPWVVLLHLEDRSISRFVDIAADFPVFPRGYAYEEVGKYYRKAGDLDRAQSLYEKAVATIPSHARIRILLGSIYFARENLDAAEQQYLVANKLDPKNYMAVEMLGQVAAQQERFEDAWGWLQKLVDLRPQEATSWEHYGFAALRTGRWEPAIHGFSKAMELNPALEGYRQQVGIALIQLRRFEEAADTFRAILARPDPRPETRLALAAVCLEMVRRSMERGRPVSAAGLDEAQGQLDTVLQQRPEDPQAADLLQRLRDLRR
jgi:Tfp pilus assembly protein PilF